MSEYKISKNKNNIIRNHSGSNNNSYANNKSEKYSNSNSKQKNKNSYFDENIKKNNNSIKNIIENNNVKQKRFNDIDEAVILIQRCFRKYLDKIHNTHSELMKIINERKKNILQNYNILDNQPITANKDKKDNNNDNFENKNNIYNNKYLELEAQLNNNKIKQLKEDIIVDYSGINNNNNYEEDSNIYNNNNENNDKNTLENDIILNNNFNKKKINIKLDDIDNNQKEENIGYGGGMVSVFEKIYKNMKKNEEMNNNNLNDNQKYKLDDEFIENKDNVIDNQLDLIKNIQQRQMENMLDNTDKEKINQNYEDILNLNKKEEIEEKMEEINEKNNEENFNNNNEKKEELNNNDNIEGNNNFDNNNEEIENKQKKNSSKNEVFQRLANYLDSTLENPENLMPKINTQKELNNIKDIDTNANININQNIDSKENQNINNYMSSVQQQADNIALNLELKEAKKTIETMSSVITDLKIQLKSKDEYLNKALLSQKNENDLLIQRQNTLMESLMSEKRQMESQINDLQSKLNEI